MENERQILVVGNIFGVGVTALTTYAQAKALKYETERDILERQIIATGYTFDKEPKELAEWLIDECATYNLENETYLAPIDFLEAYTKQHPQYVEDCKRDFRGLVNTDELKANREAMRQNAGKMEVGKYEADFEVSSVFNEFGESVKQFTLIATKLQNESLQARRNGNQKWYNQFPKRRKR